MADLLPCPFCGSDKLSVSLHVYCNTCGSDGPYRERRDDAIHMWNRRIIPSEPLAILPPRKPFVQLDDIEDDE